MFIQRHTVNMEHLLAVALLALLQLYTLTSAAPVAGDSAVMRSKVERNADQLVRKIERYIKPPVPTGLTISPLTDNMDGLSNIVVVLEAYESLISENLDGLAQVKQEVSSLAGYLDHWRRDHCGQQQSKPAVQGRLAQLQTEREYIHTVSWEALARLNEFLKQLMNMDSLDMC